MKITIVLALAVLLSSISGVAAKPRHHGPREVIKIIDNTSSAWDGIIAETVADFNQVMPRNGPRLRYVRGEHVVCTEAVPICSGPIDPRYDGLAWMLGNGRGSISLTDRHQMSQGRRENVACHELMHILTGIRDNYGAKDNSCVWGYLPDPGVFDINRLRQAYGKKGRHK